MAISLSTFPSIQTDPLQETGALKTLKDFLQENSTSSSSSSSGFQSFPRKPIAGKTRRRSLLSKTASFVRAVKNFPFPSVKTPALLPRSFSQRLKKSLRRNERETTVNSISTVRVNSISTVRLRDILRWKSFRDLEEPEPPVPEFSVSPDRYTAGGTTVTTTTSCSNSSSWCESDFTAEDFPSPCRSWTDCSGAGETGKKYVQCFGGELPEKITVTVGDGEDDREAGALWEEEEQNSPVSVVDYMTFENELENRARQFLDHLKATVPLSEICCCEIDELLLLDFFWEELSWQEREGDFEGGARNSEKMKRRAEAWVRGEEGERGEWGMKEACVREMEEREGRWRVMGVQEREELSLDIEAGILGCLVEEIFVDFEI